MRVKQLSDEQLAGQRLMVGFDGTTLTADLKYLIDTVRIGGIILFSRNIENPQQLRELCKSAQDHARAANQPPLFIAVDQEGGEVARLRSPFTEFNGNPSMKDEADAITFATITAEELKTVGINMNMAPVMDVAATDVKSIMTGRSFSSDPDRTARLGVTVIDQFQKSGIMAVAKHFPGIGRTTLDSHLDRPFLETDADTLMKTDIVPFMAAIDHQVAGIMFSHIVYEGLDPHWPASLSPAIAVDLLRKKCGYTGLILTDDLDMGAIKKYYPLDTVIAQIMAADVDQVLICHRSPDIETAAEMIASHQHNSSAMREQARTSVKRILSLKSVFLS
jgi:beta-N-acetylhexosaminidase